MSRIHTTRFTLDNFTGRLGVKLLLLMPLISLTNVWEVAAIGDLSIRGIDLLFLLVSCIWIQHIFLHGKVRRGVSLFLGLISTFLLISFFGSIFLPDYQVRWPPLLRFAQTLLWGGLALSFVRRERDLKIIARNIITAGAVLGLFSIYLYLTRTDLHRIAGYFSAAGGEGLGRQASFNEIGALYALGALLSLCYLFWGSKSRRRWNLIATTIGLILNIIGLVLVQSRSAFLAFTVGCLALLLPELKKLLVYGKISKRIITYGVTILIIGILVTVNSIYFLNINRIVLSFLAGSSEYTSAIMRLALWSKASQVWLNKAPYFLLGYGFRSADRFIEAESAHNFFLNIGLWLGVAGLVPAIVLLIWPTIKVTNRMEDTGIARVIIAAFSIALVVSMFGNVLVDPFYGGCTFLLLYGALAVSSATPKIRRS